MIVRLAACVAVIALAVILASPPPAAAQSELSEEPLEGLDADELKRRLDDAWDRMMEEVGPTIDGLGKLLDTFGKIDGIENYESPEILPNGDIILRRRADAPPLEPAPREPEPGPPRGEGPAIKT